jgi:hypothetical protein
VQDVGLGTMLSRPCPGQLFGLPITYSKENRGQVPAVYIKSLRDMSMTVPAQNWIVEHLGPFKEVVEIDGGHFWYWPRIDEFTQLVFRLTDQYFVK